MNTYNKVNTAIGNTKSSEPRVRELLSKCKSVILSTLNTDGEPSASYAPHVIMNNKLYILVSLIARHTNNLTDLKKASVMFIEDENSTKQIYARERLILDVLAKQIYRDSTNWDFAIDKLRENHGKILDILVNMDDFIMIELSPIKGSYINGFGNAYRMDSNFEIQEHITDISHEIRK